tara:strand:- start:952 stop:1146 length:195 start_codon:yes stop_codon:yes gene_type:complete
MQEESALPPRKRFDNDGHKNCEKKPKSSRELLEIEINTIESLENQEAIPDFLFFYDLVKPDNDL